MGSGTDTKIDEQLMSNRPLVANRFEIQDLLGRGGMGEVYRATEI
jgi:serine/threonine protein kinase